MKSASSTCQALLGLLLIAAAGCSCGHHQCDSDSVWYGGGAMCFGYYPTCWRPWPAECPPCPPPLMAPGATWSAPETIEQPSPASPPLPDAVLPIPMSPLVPKP